MAKRFNFMKRVDGTVETFYPKTSTDNIIKETSNGEKKLDTILDEKGAFVEYNETNVKESTGNDLFFEVVGDIINSDKMETLKGIIATSEEPSDKKYLWVDTSNTPYTLKCYNESSNNWEIIFTAASSNSSNDFTDYYKKKLDGIEANANYFDLKTMMSVNLSVFATDSNHRTVTEVEKSKWDDKYTKSEIENLIATLPLGLIWKQSVADKSSIFTEYPNPENNWTTSTESGEIYTYDGSEWVQINVTVTPVVDLVRNGLMSPSMLEKLNNIEDGANKFSISDVSADDISDGVSKVLMTTSERTQLADIPNRYRDVNNKILEKDIDPQLIAKLSVKDGSLINDFLSQTSTTYSSQKIDQLFENLATDIENGKLSESDMDEWFK